MNSAHDQKSLTPSPAEPVWRSKDYEGAGETLNLDLERYWLEARVLKFWIAGIIAAFLLLSLVVTLLMQPVYEAQSRIEVSQITANVTDIDPLDGGANVSENQYLNTQYELLESRFMAERVVEAGNLMRDEAFLDAFDL
ncbi:MAG: Wzz/FepE/Etk N-terminal domain-containing protein, partial [Myxococcota bacterium]